MKQQKQRTLTQDELIAELNRRGYEVTKRALTDWRANDLLPSFDNAGAGGGRSRYLWFRSEPIIQQSVWVCELLRIYNSFGSLYLPLWMLGYTVPLVRVRQALSEPLNYITRSIETEVESSGDLEDLIGDVAYDMTEKMKRMEVDLMQVPQEAYEAIVNVLFNKNYDLTDAPFEDAVEALKNWMQSVQRSKGEDVAGDAVTPRQTDGAESLLAYAPFVKEFLSAHQLKRAVDECTEDGLHVVGRDLDAVREIALTLHKLLAIMSRDMPVEFKPTSAQILPSLFMFGRLLIWTDLSLRHKGYGETVEHCVGTLLRKCREEVNEQFEAELAANSRNFATAMETTYTMMVGGSRQQAG